MRHCLCCDRSLLRHIFHAQLHWYCPHCHQFMPCATAPWSLDTFPATATNILSPDASSGLSAAAFSLAEAE